MSGFRANLRAGCKTVIDAVQTAHPTKLAHTLDHTPATFRTPLAYVANNIVEPTITHDSGTRARELIAEIHLVNRIITNDQTADEQDELVDRVVDAVTANPRAVTGALIEPVSVDGHEEQDGSATYSCSIVNVRGRILQGRS